MKQRISVSMDTRLVKALDDLAVDKRILPLNRSQQIEELLVQLPEVQKRLLVKE